MICIAQKSNKHQGSLVGGVVMWKSRLTGSSVSLVDQLMTEETGIRECSAAARIASSRESTKTKGKDCVWK